MLYLLHAVFTAELVDATARIDDLLLAGVKRMTGGAHLNEEVFTERRARCELISAATGYFDVAVVWMDVGFHCHALHSTRECKKGALFAPQKGA